MWLASMVSPSWENASDRPSATAPFGFQAGLLTEVHPIRTPSQPKPVAYVRIVPITALGTWRSLTAFPILPRHRLGHLEAFTVWHGRYWPIQPRLGPDRAARPASPLRAHPSPREEPLGRHLGRACRSYRRPRNCAHATNPLASGDREKGGVPYSFARLTSSRSSDASSRRWSMMRF